MNTCSYITLEGVTMDNNIDKKIPDAQTLGNLAKLFKVFGDTTRIRIIAALLDGEMCVYNLSEALEMGQSAISHQLRILRSAGLVRPRREGRTVYYSLDDEHIQLIYNIGLAHINHKKIHLREEENE